MAYWRKSIGTHQLEFQMQALKTERNYVREQLNLHTTTLTWNLYETLVQLVEAAETARKELERAPCNPRTRLDGVIIRIYLWAMEPRWKPTQE